MLFSQLLPLALVTLAVAEQAKITFYSGFEYQGKEAELPTTDPASQDECVDIHFLLHATNSHISMAPPNPRGLQTPTAFYSGLRGARAVLLIS
ncbi:hypothetical protein V490_03824 [Pseudogymnoascus sp. VKM F-3557]|nr:hypothetical protein V490_03824 [Pseudogymnoascus sp. VKM F-3557]